MGTPAARRGRLRLAVSVLVAVALLALFFRGIAWSDLGDALSRARLSYVLGAFLMTGVTYALRAWRWGGLLLPLARVRFRHLFSATVVGFMAAILIPRAGEILRPFLVGRRHGVPTSAAFASIIIERLFDLVTVLALFGVYTVLLPAPSSTTTGSLMRLIKLGGAAAALGALLVIGVLVAAHRSSEGVGRFVDRLLRVLPSRFADPLSKMTRSFLDGLGILRAPIGHLAALFGQSILVWLSIDLGVTWANKALGVDLPFHASFLIIAFLTVGVAVPTPGNVGGYHETYLLALTQAFGVDHVRAAAAGLVSHLCATVPVLLMGLWFLRGEGLTLSGVAHVAEEDKP